MTIPRAVCIVMAIAAGPSAVAQSPLPDATCPVTIMNGLGLVRPAGEPPAGNHGNDSRTIATALWPGTVAFKPGGPGCVDPDGTLGMKWPWWRGTRGSLTIEGRRLDGPAAPLRASIPHGYGQTGFQVSGLMFPTPGCWEVTGRVGAESLTFVVHVIKIDAGPATTCPPLGIYERTASRP
jgi:hypothetical protein